MSNKKTFVAFVLDESGSMYSQRSNAISSFNEQLDAIKDNGALGGDTYVCVYTLGGKIECRRPLVSYDKIERLTEADYSPHGWTPLYDAVGVAVQTLEAAMDKETGDDIAALVVVITDGMENYSKEFTTASLKSKLDDLQASKKWTFAFLGTTMEQALAAEAIGVSRGSTKLSSIAKMGAPAAAAGPISSYMSSRSEGSTSVPDYFASTIASEEDDKQTT